MYSSGFIIELSRQTKEPGFRRAFELRRVD